MQKSTQIERLSKVIASNTSYSRRQAEKLIDEGRVSVDGKKIMSQEWMSLKIIKFLSTKN